MSRAEEMDADGNGLISREEFHEILKDERVPWCGHRVGWVDHFFLVSWWLLGVCFFFFVGGGLHAGDDQRFVFHGAKEKPSRLFMSSGFHV